MNIGTLILTIILFAIGIVIVFLNPLSPVAISFGMFLVAVSILSVAIQIYFPATPSRPVELRVVERRVKPKPRRKPVRKAKRTVKKTKTRKRR
ncbi:MAG: hypothetical protein ABIE55_04110 [Candidatus Aenigmatarchaeota archaeon]